MGTGGRGWGQALRQGVGLKTGYQDQQWCVCVEGGQLQVLEWEGTCDKTGRGSWDI